MLPKRSCENPVWLPGNEITNSNIGSRSILQAAAIGGDIVPSQLIPEPAV